MSEQDSYRILLIEDNRADAELLRFAFGECGERISVDVLADSTRLIHYMHKQGDFAAAGTPDLVVLDYHHPINGGVALAQLGGSPDLMHIPVVVVTGSDDPRVVYEAYARHANCVFRKPCDLDSMIALACDIVRFWFNKAVLPVRGRAAAPAAAT